MQLASFFHCDAQLEDFVDKSPQCPRLLIRSSGNSDGLEQDAYFVRGTVSGLTAREEAGCELSLCFRKSKY
jgi:hypothetical protein